jgi:hypothetical protein
MLFNKLESGFVGFCCPLANWSRPSRLVSSRLGVTHSAILLGCQGLTKHITESATTAMFDATFGIVPGYLDVLNVRSAQVFNVLCDYKNAVICVLTVVMSSRKIDLYKAVLDSFKDLFPNFRPRVSMADWETSMRKAIAVTWPDTRLLGCR